MAAQLIQTLAPAAPDAPVGGLVWLAKRNCSLTPGQVMGFFASLSLLSLLVAALCWFSGAKLVTPFTCAELLVLGIALLAWARHAADRERVEFGAELVVVEWESAGRLQRTELPTRSTRILLHDNGLVVLRAAGSEVFVGRYTRPERREQLARELRKALLAA